MVIKKSFLQANVCLALVNIIFLLPIKSFIQENTREDLQSLNAVVKIRYRYSHYHSWTHNYIVLRTG